MRHRLVLFSLLITWVSYNALAQLNPLSENAHARMVFQRALTAENREDWEILIGLGIQAEGYGASDAREISRIMLVRWLTERWIAEAGAPDRRMLEDAIARGNRRYLYIYDSAKNSYRRDSAGDLMLQGIEGYEEAREKGAKPDKDAWLDEVNTAGNTALAAWWERTRAVYLELLASEGINEHGDIATALSASIARYQAAAERDFHGLTVRHERRLSHLRLRDTLSARREGESRSAGEVTEKLVSAAQNSLQASTDSLEAAIPEPDDVGAVKVNPKEWQASFRRQFEAGLEAWGSAEDRFVAQRLKWETNAQKAYISAEESWDRAFGDFDKKRKEWFTRMNRILAAAGRSWNTTISSFEKDIKSELDSLKAAGDKEQAVRRKEANTYLETFKQAAGVLAMAEENITYLKEREKYLKKRGVEAAEDIADLREEIETLRQPEYEAQKAIEAWEEREAELLMRIGRSGTGGYDYSYTEYSDDDDDDSGTTYYVITVGGESYLDMNYGEALASVRSSLQNARTRKADAIAEVKFEIDTKRAAIVSRQSTIEKNTDLNLVQQELLHWQGEDGTGGLKAQFTRIREEERTKILDFVGRVSGTLVGTNSAELEKHRLTRLIGMLEQEQSIARAVNAYARDITSDRATRAQTAENLKAAEKDMARKQEAYQKAVERLKSLLSGGVAGKQNALNTQQRELAKLHGRLSEAKQELRRAMGAYRLQDVGVFDRLLKGMDKDAEAFLNKDKENTAGCRNLMNAYFGPAWRMVVTDKFKNIQTVAAQLISGNEEQDIASRKKLEDYHTALKSITLTGFSSTEAFKTHLIENTAIPSDDPVVAALERAHRAVMAAAEGTPARTKAELVLKARLNKAAADADYKVKLRSRALELVNGRYNQDGTLRDKNQLPLVLSEEGANTLKEAFRLSAAQKELAYRKELLTKQLAVNVALSRAAGIKNAWITELKNAVTAASNNLRTLQEDSEADASDIEKAQQAKTDAETALAEAENAESPGTELVNRLKNELSKNDEDKLALTLYLNGARALAEGRITAVKTAQANLNGAEVNSAESIENALKSRPPHEGQFIVLGANLLDELVAPKREEYDAARAKFDALERYGRLGFVGLEKRLEDQVRAIRTTVDRFTGAADAAINSGNKDQKINPDVFAAEYSRLISLGAPSSLTETLGMYAVALAAEGRLRARDKSEIAEIKDKNKNLAAAHQQLALLLADPSTKVTLSSLAGRDLPAGTEQPNALKATLYREILEAATGAAVLPNFRESSTVEEYLKRAEDIPKELNELSEHRRGFINAESAYRGNLVQRIVVGIEKEVFNENKSEYHKKQIVPLQRRIARLQKDVSSQEQSIKDALREFIEAVRDYEEQGDKVKSAEESFQTARLNLRIAEAINDYARSGAVESAPDPQKSLESIKKELIAANAAREVINDLIERNAKNPVRDAEIQELLETESDQLQAVQELTLVKEKLETEVGKLQGNMRLAKNTIRDFLIEKAYYPNSSKEKDKPGALRLNKDDLNDLDLSKVSIEEFRKRKARFSQYGEYFKNGDKIQYASDLAGWIMGIKTNGGSEFLRRMSVAMMYELHMAQGYQNYSNFVPEEWTDTDEDGNTVTTYSSNPHTYFARTPGELRAYNLSPFLDASNNIHKSLQPTAAVRSIQARTLIEVSKIRVFGLALGNRYSEEEAMERMLPRARSSWSAVKDTPEYHFFRLLMTIAAKDGADPLPLRSDIVNSAVQDHVIASMKLDGASYRSYLDSFWYPKERESITNAMNNMPNHWHWNKINEFLQNGKLTKDMNEWRGYVKSLKALNEDTPTENSVKKAIKDRDGTLNASVNAALQHELGKVIAAGKGGIVAVVAGARERVIDELADTDKRLKVRSRELTRKAETLEKGYAGILARFLNGEATRTQLTQAAGERYRSLGFDTLGYLTGRTDNASGVRTHNTQGEAEKFTNLIERALAQAAYGDSAAHRKVRHGYDMDRKQLKRSLDERQTEITSLIKLARTEWRTSRTRLEGMRIRWRRDTKERYEDSSELWDLRHAQLAAGREKWLEESTRAGMIAGSRAVAVQWDIEAKTLIADAESAVIPSLSIDIPSLSQLVEDAAGGTVLDALIERAGQMTPRGSDTAMVVAAYLPSLNVNAAKASVARSITQSLFDQVTERAAVLTAIRARDQFDKQLAGMEKGIDDANENVEKMLANQMRAAGYRREGAIWRRQSVIGSTLFGGEEWEDQHVGTYRRFTSPGFRARTDLSNKALKGLSGAEIFTLVERASEEMTRYQVLIFGRSDEQRSEKTKDGKTNAKYVKPADADEFHKVLKAILKDSREAWKTSAGASRHSDTEGLFNFHVGYRPVMKGEEVSEAGYGQMGRIMSQFMTNEARMGRGHAALMTPDYRKPMWDDDADNDGKSDGIIAAPSLATVIDIAANIVIAAVLPGGVGNVILGAALNLVDDFIFATADVATGYATSEQAFGAFGKKALVSAATTVTGGFLNGFGSATSAGADKFLAGGLRGLVKTSSSLGRAAVNSGFAAATATVNKVMSRGIHVAVDGGSWEDFAEDFDSVRDWAGVAAATVQAGVGSLAGDFFTTDGTNWGLEENIFNTGALRGAASLTGNLSGALTEYAMSGRTSLNLLNMSMFNLEDAKGGRLSGGLLQLNLGGGGNLFNIGQGGWSTSIDTIAAAMGGLDEIRRVSRAKIAGEGSHALGVLNMVNYQATGGDYRLARDIWNRNIKVAFEDLGKTAYGLYRHRETPDTIVVNQRYNTNDREDAAVLASAGSHEGQHLYDRRDLGYTTEAGAHGRSAKTYAALIDKLELQGNEGLVSAIMSGVLNPESYENNTGDVDYLEPFIDEMAGVLGVRPSNFFERAVPQLFPREIGSVFGHQKTIGENLADMLQLAGKAADTMLAFTSVMGGGSSGNSSVANVMRAIGDIATMSSFNDNMSEMHDSMINPDDILSDPVSWNERAHRINIIIKSAMRNVLNAEGMEDLEWYRTRAKNDPNYLKNIDKRTFSIADKIGFDYEIDIDPKWTREDREAAANQILYGMMFIADMHEGRGMSTDHIKILMEGTVGPPERWEVKSDVIGIKSGIIHNYLDIYGFEDRISGPVTKRSGHSDNFDTVNELNLLEKMEYFYSEVNKGYRPSWMYRMYPPERYNEFERLRKKHSSEPYYKLGNPALLDIANTLYRNEPRSPYGREY